MFHNQFDFWFFFYIDIYFHINWYLEVWVNMHRNYNDICNSIFYLQNYLLKMPVLCPLKTLYMASYIFFSYCNS